jgi:hypothetical protein
MKSNNSSNTIDTSIKSMVKDHIFWKNAGIWEYEFNKRLEILK